MRRKIKDDSQGWFAMEVAPLVKNQRNSRKFRQILASFNEFGTDTIIEKTEFCDGNQNRHVIETFVNEFWTAKQRAASSIHEISYRACFKPQLPRFFIEKLTDPGDWVYD